MALTTLTLGVCGEHGGDPDSIEFFHHIAELENGPTALACNGGMSALACVFFGLLEPGQTVLAASELFGFTAALLRGFERWGVRCERVDASDPSAVRQRLARGDVRMLVAETVSNPLLRVVDVGRLAFDARHAGTLLVVDNTFATPTLCRPVALGADLVIESATKFLAGHMDVVIGTVAGGTALVDRLRDVAVKTSAVIGPFEAWLARRGLETLGVRMRQAGETGTALAGWLAEHPTVVRVHHPALDGHPDHRTATATLTSLNTAVLSFELADSRDAANRFIRGLRPGRLVHSLGGTQTTVSHPASSSHRSVPAEERRSAGIHHGLVRVSIGLEDVEELRAEFETALTAAAT